MKKLLLITTRGLNALTSVKFVCGVLTGCGFIAIVLATAVGIL